MQLALQEVVPAGGGETSEPRVTIKAKDFGRDIQFQPSYFSFQSHVLPVASYALDLFELKIHKIKET